MRHRTAGHTLYTVGVRGATVRVDGRTLFALLQREDRTRDSFASSVSTDQFHGEPSAET